MYKAYTGVGSRKTPAKIQVFMRTLATEFEQRGFTLRSGGAQGADLAFEAGVTSPQNKEIYKAYQAHQKAMDIARQFHPAWDKCSDYARKLHGRNAFQVLGVDLQSPSKFLVCWTPDGCYEHRTRCYHTGGTGTAISIADYYAIPVFNLARPEHLSKLEEILKETITA